MPPLLDLRPYARDAHLVQTHIRVRHGYDGWKDWILAGPIKLWRSNNREHWDLCCYLLEHTDAEHDSAYILSMDLVGLEMDHMEYGATQFTAYISANDPQDLRVPTVDYNPLKGAVKCKECKGKNAHLLVERFTPPENEDLFFKMAGRRVEITQRLVRPKDEV